MKKKVLMIVGSMREQSFNKQLANIIEEKLSDRAEVTRLDYADIPFMNQDIEFPAPEVIVRVRNEVASADGIWFVTPEYNYSYPGVLKNLLDWLSRPLKQGDPERVSAISGKKAVISGAAGKSAASGARGNLTDLLGFMRVELLPEEQIGVALDGEAFATDKLKLTSSEEEKLEAQAAAFLKFICE